MADSPPAGSPGAEDHDVALRRILARVLDGPGALPPEVRRCAAEGRGLPEPLAAYVAKLGAPSEALAAADVEALLRAGLSDDAVFELTVSAILGAAKRRLDAGLRALQEAEAPGTPAPT